MRLNDRVNCGDFDEIIATNRRGEERGRAKIDCNSALSYRYFLNRFGGYIVRTVHVADGRRLKHQLAADLLGIAPGQGVHRLALVPDHINGDHLDNRVANLRVATRAQNSSVWSETPGATLHADGRRWKAEIRVGGRLVYLGLFPRRCDATAAYREASRLVTRIPTSEHTSLAADLDWRQRLREVSSIPSIEAAGSQ